MVSFEQGQYKNRTKSLGTIYFELDGECKSTNLKHKLSFVELCTLWSLSSLLRLFVVWFVVFVQLEMSCDSGSAGNTVGRNRWSGHGVQSRWRWQWGNYRRISAAEDELVPDDARPVSLSASRNSVGLCTCQCESRQVWQWSCVTPRRRRTHSRWISVHCFHKLLSKFVNYSNKLVYGTCSRKPGWAAPRFIDEIARSLIVAIVNLVCHLLLAGLSAALW